MKRVRITSIFPGRPSCVERVHPLFARMQDATLTLHLVRIGAASMAVPTARATRLTDSEIAPIASRPLHVGRYRQPRICSQFGAAVIVVAPEGGVRAGADHPLNTQLRGDRPPAGPSIWPLGVLRWICEPRRLGAWRTAGAPGVAVPGRFCALRPGFGLGLAGLMPLALRRWG